MKKLLILKISLAIGLLILVSNLSISAQKVDCTKVTDDELVKTIQEKLSEKYADQMEHINIHVKDGEVFIEGWTTTKKISKDIEKIVKKIKCVKKVFNKLRIGTGGGCTEGTKPCGEICIPNNQTCNIKTKGGN